MQHRLTAVKASTHIESSDVLVQNLNFLDTDQTHVRNVSIAHLETYSQ